MSDGGKGDKPRPISVDREKFASNWDMIFKKDNQEKGNNERITGKTEEELNNQGS